MKDLGHIDTATRNIGSVFTQCYDKPLTRKETLSIQYRHHDIQCSISVLTHDFSNKATWDWNTVPAKSKVYEYRFFRLPPGIFSNSTECMLRNTRRVGAEPYHGCSEEKNGGDAVSAEQISCLRSVLSSSLAPCADLDVCI